MIPKVDFGMLNPMKASTFQMRRTRPKTGLAPGSLIHTGKQYTDRVTIDIIQYNGKDFHEVCITDIASIGEYNNPEMVTWINIQGLHDTKIIEQIGEILGLHSLTLEDILDTNQRPKVEDFEDYIYLSLKMINHVSNVKKIDIEQVSLVFHENFVLSFQERPGDVFNDVRNRLRNSKGKSRKRKADYLGYMLLDIVVDFYFETLDQIWSEIEHLEEMVVKKPEKIKLRELQMVRKDLIQLRIYMNPVRDVIQSLTTRNSGFFEENTLMYLRDSHDHAVQVVESLDTYREILTSVMDLYVSQLSMKMNEVMKVLTLMSTIFIPLTFITGIFGMNFVKMPELSWDWAYPVGFYICIGVVTIIMILFMKSRKWF